nr:MAG TPA: Chromatin remodeling complex ATPase [Caudoviricetes sp.]
MDQINNTTKTLKDDLSVEIKQGSKISIAAACFSIYAFQELKAQLSQIDELRFIFTSPTFVTEKAKKERREFYIPRLTRERNLYGTEFEVKLRNELTQKAIAKECAEWIKKKVTFKSNVSNENMMGFINVDDKNYMPINEFSTVGLGCERGNNAYNIIQKTELPFSKIYLELFDQLWDDKTKLQNVTDEVIDNITAAYKENSPDFIYFVTLYNIFNEFLDDISEDVLPNEATGFKESKIWGMLYNFQKDAALAIINKLEKYNGCILADSVGLGKTFTALAVIKYYENRNKSVLVLCPKKLTNNWNTYKDNYVNNPIAADRLRYDVLYHTDLNRTHGTSNGLDLDRLNWGNYDLVVIDESHNFRNGGKLVENPDEDTKDNRYVTLMKKVIRAGVKTKVLMLSATPVNNRFNDLKNQLALAYEGHTDYIDEKLNTARSIDEIFKNAQRAFNTWSKWEPCDRTTENLLKMLDFDFFEVLDSVTIARSRKHIQKYYDMADIGTFPTRLKPISLRPHLTDLKKAISYNEIFEQLMLLTLTIYTPTHYILPSKMEKYAELYGDNKVNVGFTQANREQGIRRLTAINLMKRMESSVYSFNLTLIRIKDLINSTIKTIDRFDKHSGTTLDLTDISDMDEFDAEDQNSDELFSFGRKVKIDLADMDYVSWRDTLEKDAEILELLTYMIGDITPEHDSKLQELFRVINNKITHPINGGNKKLIIFTAFADTADYLYDNVSRYVKENFGLNTAMISGSVEGRTTCPKLHADLNTVLTCFSPISKGRDLFDSIPKVDIDILIATDCISEGQNLQDCDYLINYDIHWNPVRIIQRFGRIDRIGSKNKVIQLVNFWPDVTLDDYINLKAKVETRMKIVDMTATGDDNLLSDEEKTDLEYRKAQLKKLQDEVVDIEDMTTGISIMDLGLNEFRLDLLDYIKYHPDIDKAPFGLHSVVTANEDAPAGVIYVLKNRSDSVNINNKNRLHPFYMVYIGNDGEVICDHLSPKEMLDKMRLLCKGKTEPIPEAYKPFNKETRDGRNMSQLSKLLGDAIASIIEVKDESDIDSFLGGGQVSFLSNEIKGLDDFELISFLVVRRGKNS